VAGVRTQVGHMGRYLMMMMTGDANLGGWAFRPGSECAPRKHPIQVVPSLHPCTPARTTYKWFSA
jgi:hypothetical protein